MTDSPALHFGWHLDAYGDPRPLIPVNLKASGLKTHTAFLAQSGSGKSFALGRFLEEILSKTRARVVVIDPNSDFVKLSEPEPKVWTDPRFRQWLAADDDRNSFIERWNKVKVRILTMRNSDDLALKNKNALQFKPLHKWSDFSYNDAVEYLGLSFNEDPLETIGLKLSYDIVLGARGLEFGDHSDITIEELKAASAELLNAVAAGEKRSAQIIANLPFHFDRTSITVSAAARLNGLLYQHSLSKLWSEDDYTRTINGHVSELLDFSSDNRVIVLDLPSIDTRDERLVMTGSLLESLWSIAGERWSDALRNDVKEDKRTPVFIVIDEAHNMAPLESVDSASRVVSEKLLRVAAEGRKYGLFLVVVTQRPSRIHPGVLSQCDNLCLMKMNNRLDIELAAEMFGFVPEGWARRAMDFKVGNALLSGSFVDQAVYVHAAPRRTAEGGRNLVDSHWIQDPMQSI